MLETKRQLDKLLADCGFLRIVTGVTREVMYKQNVSHEVAFKLVLSAIGEPKAFASVYSVWSSEKPTEQKCRLVWTIVRRRVIDLLRKDARRPGHISLLVDADDLGADTWAISFGGEGQDNPQIQLENRQVAQMVRVALFCFSGKGDKQEEQARLLRRYALEQATYMELSKELSCPEGALRVRVHKAMRALRRHIRICHPDLLEQIVSCASPRSM
jgi:DNA-directed RNA polymerase specialized sigma24 family protein